MESQEKETRMSINLQVKNFSVYSNLTESYPLFTLKAICINSFVNLKIEWLQKIKKKIVYEIDCSNFEAVYLVNLNDL